MLIVKLVAVADARGNLSLVEVESDGGAVDSCWSKRILSG